MLGSSVDLLGQKFNVREETVVNLGVFTTLEKGGNPNQTYIVVPHHGVFAVIVRCFKGILKH